MSQDEGQGFLSRWSRRKAQVQQGGAAAPNAVSPEVLQSSAAPVRDEATAQGSALRAFGTRPAATSLSSTSDASSAPRDTASPTSDADVRSSAHAPAEPAPRPTLQDVEQLDAQSDYRNFVARDVDPEVRNAAFKKLFHSDPHFNVMDGLDVYIDDYNTPNPLPVSIMKTLVQARALGLIDDELKEQELPAREGAQTSSEPAAVEASHDGVEPIESAQTEGAAVLDAAPLGVDSSCAPALVQDGTAGGSNQAALVELVMVPDVASNDEPVSSQPTAAVAEGTVVPFPRRPGSEDPV